MCGALEQRDKADAMKEAKIRELEATVAKEREERQEMGKYIEDLEASLAPHPYSDVALEDAQGMNINIPQDELGLPRIHPKDEAVYKKMYYNQM